MKNSNDTIRIRTRDLPACSVNKKNNNFKVLIHVTGGEEIVMEDRVATQYG
jgi:hypothetical protein